MALAGLASEVFSLRAEETLAALLPINQSINPVSFVGKQLHTDIDGFDTSRLKLTRAELLSHHIKATGEGKMRRSEDQKISHLW